MALKKIGKVERYVDYNEIYSNGYCKVPHLGFFVNGTDFIFSSFSFGIGAIKEIVALIEKKDISPTYDFKFFNMEIVNKVENLSSNLKYEGDKVRAERSKEIQELMLNFLEAVIEQTQHKIFYLWQYKQKKEQYGNYTHVPVSNISVVLYKGNIYKFDRTDLSDEHRLLQIMELEDKERKEFERLKQRFSEAEKIENENKRQPISEEVRIAVWRRDEGKCVKCSSRLNLEYDHIIPISKGGSNTVRNIELLCEGCNRQKSANIQ